MADTQTRLAPDTTPVHEWRTTLQRAGRCWFGALLLVLALGGLFAVGEEVRTIVTMFGLFAAAAVLTTLLALVIESVREREVTLRGHAGLAALGGALTLGVLSLNPWFAMLGAVAGFIATGLGAAVTAGRPTWRRYAALAAGALAIGVLVSLG